MLCRYVRNIGLNAFMATVEKATLYPADKEGTTTVNKQVVMFNLPDIRLKINVKFFFLIFKPNKWFNRKKSSKKIC